MKICLVSAYFYPQSRGGTEKYVYELAKKLISAKNEVEIITGGPTGMEDYHYDSILIRVIEEEKSTSQSIISGKQASLNLNSFISVLKEQQYDLVHFHTLTPTFGLYHMSEVKALGMKLYFTAHVPSITCIHGDLMQYGQIACDGKILKQRCTACYLSKKEIPKWVSIFLAGIINQLGYPETIAGVVEQKQQDVLNLNTLCDQIFIFTNWQKRIFITNGIDESRLTLTQQMPVMPPSSKRQPFVQKKGSKINLAFIGRICHEKGLHVLLKAFNSLKDENIGLHIAAIVEHAGDPYFLKMKQLAKNNPNIYWSYDLDDKAMEHFYQMADVICIPSIWYETGPYVLYEAFKYHLPVIANNLGDMQVWKANGYPIELYTNEEELISILKTIIPN